MEESEKRKERLRAMRVEASEADGFLDSQSPAVTGVLANPLVETSTVQDSCAMPRFDYYTDPMAAFSGNKRQTNVGQSLRDYATSGGGGRASPRMQFPPSSLGPRNPGMRPYAYQARPHYIPDQGMQQAGNPHHYGSGPIRSPMAMINPHPEHQRHGFSGGYNTPRPGLQWARAGTASFSSSHGRGNWVNTSSFPNPGRGWGRGRGRPGNVSGGRGIGYQGNAPPSLYRKSMVEDPWKDLEPVVWRGLNSTRSSELFQNFSSDAKKPRVAEAYNVSKSKESLADYLAAAFDEAVEEGGGS